MCFGLIVISFDVHTIAPKMVLFVIMFGLIQSRMHTIIIVDANIFQRWQFIIDFGYTQPEYVQKMR